jgi:glycosyltransferase involved in cell wall biosynthesis
VTFVAIDVGPTLGPVTGIGQFVVQLVDALSALPEPPSLRRYALSFRAELPADVHRLPYPAALTLRAWGRADHPRARRSLGGADVVHGTNYVVPPSGLPSVVTVHDCSLLTRPELVNATVRAFAPVLRRAIDRGAWVHTPSAYVAAQAVELLGAQRVRVVPHGPPGHLVTTPTGLLPLPGLNGRPYVLALGTREPRKNLARLVEAFGLLHAEHPELALVLVGPDGPDRPNIDAAVGRLPRLAAEQVLLTDWVTDEHRTGVLARATVLAYPSLDEGFGFPLLEAMQLGVPVVGAAAGAIPEIAADAALLVDPGDVAALAGALAAAIADDALRDRLIAAGRARLTAFSWSRSAEAFADLYRDAAMDGQP